MANDCRSIISKNLKYIGDRYIINSPQLRARVTSACKHQRNVNEDDDWIVAMHMFYKICAI